MDYTPHHFEPYMHNLKGIETKTTGSCTIRYIALPEVQGSNDHAAIKLFPGVHLCACLCQASVRMSVTWVKRGVRSCALCCMCPCTCCLMCTCQAGSAAVCGGVISTSTHLDKNSFLPWFGLPFLPLQQGRTTPKPER